ncbi:MAG: fumarylacetoacetate hydrolase family protein [Desulfocapsaceae bacterium]|nr:fumarylacetoacetate hydrolase family protein [Desulfocapsaceae bacterium]
MKLCRYGAIGQEHPGLVDSDNRVRDLSAYVDDIGTQTLSPESLARIASLPISDMPVVSGEPRFGVPVAGVSKIIAIGLSYRDHADEVDMPIPTEPIIFLKAATCLSGPNDNIVKPPHSTKLDCELELGVVIGSKAQYVDEVKALEYVAGYCIMNDVSERSFQFQSSQWDKGKGCDSFGPLGPWLVTKEEVPDPQGLDMWLEVNGKRRQTGNTEVMIFSIAQIVACCSRYMTLLPGDVICTGTPPGVGMGMKPEPVWLKMDDVVHLWIDGLGEQQQTVVAWPGRNF